MKAYGIRSIVQRHSCAPKELLKPTSELPPKTSLVDLRRATDTDLGIHGFGWTLKC